MWERARRPITQLCLQPAGAIFLSIRASHGWGSYGVLGLQEGPASPNPSDPSVTYSLPQSPSFKATYSITP